jgi:hypothetical protein
MNKLLFFTAVILFGVSCKNKQQHANAPVVNNVPQDAVSNFFPVTSFIKGQIIEIKKGGISPLKITTVGNHKDSVWLKMEDLDKELAPFLQPVIDTQNLSNLFIEKKFLDQSIDAFTFTYDPIRTLPDSIKLQHWDVYVKPEDGLVKRIYLVKKINDIVQQQLTWLTDDSAKILTLKNGADGNTNIAEELIIKWGF